MKKLLQNENTFLIVRGSRNGKGVFSKKHFKPNEIVFEIEGQLITCNQDDDIDEKTRDNTYRYDEEMYLSPKGTLGNFFNHSCEPNSKVVKKGKKLFIVSITDIPKNRQVVIDYSTLIASDDSWTMKCHCGKKICRGVIKKFELLPKRIKDLYIKEKIVPRYIMKL